jgi:transcriptional regulator with XRE-family HTH domain
MEGVEPFGKRLKRLRLAAGLSQRELAFPGCTAVYICRIEKGQRHPSLQVIRTLAGRLGVTVQYLETGVEPSTEEDRRVVADVLGFFRDVALIRSVPSAVPEIDAAMAALDRLATTREVRCTSDGVNPASWSVPAGVIVTLEVTGPDVEDMSQAELDGPYEGP